jgi:hypothetical protein
MDGRVKHVARFTVAALATGASLLLVGCAVPRPAPDAEPRPAQAPPATIGPEPAPSPPPAAPPPAAPKPATPAPLPPVTAPVRPAASSATQPKAVTPAATPIAKPPPPPAPPKAPTLDLGSLEQRLKDTKAIGVFTKLSLKNQVDDLLGQLRAFHKSAAKTPPAALRQKYDTLIIKVLTLLQDGDPQLASAIASSRETLWGILIDPQKFSQI